MDTTLGFMILALAMAVLSWVIRRQVREAGERERRAEIGGRLAVLRMIAPDTLIVFEDFYRGRGMSLNKQTTAAMYIAELEARLKAV